MNTRWISLVCAAAISMAAMAAVAHPGKHDQDDEKELPTTCSELADTERFTNDPAYPEVKALKERCEAQAPKKTEDERG